MKKYDVFWGLVMILLSPIVVAQGVKEDNWLDSGHSAVQERLQVAADDMNRWFGDTAKSGEARVRLRVMLDNRWNEYDGYSLRPRVRGSLRLPTLEERLSVVFGDESMDYPLENTADIAAESRRLENNRQFNFNEMWRDHASVGLRWVPPIEREDLQTSLGVGVRSGGDIYLKAQVNKTWYHPQDFQTYSELFYRYGLKSEHYIRGNLELSHVPDSGVISANQLRIDYAHRDGHEGIGWGNSISRKHMLGQDTWFNYGLYFGGEIDGSHFTLNTYGPFAGARVNMYRNWLFVQPELTYYNDKRENRNHHLGIMLRLEALF